jgi:opacity protein-like surface antigen
VQEGIAVRWVALAAAMVCACGLHAAADDDLQPSGDPVVLDGVLQPVSLSRDGGGSRRFYVAGIIGDSFATLATPLGPDGDIPGDPSPSPAASQSLFTAGGALGLAFDALDRAWRVEFEGRGRNNLVNSRISTFDATDGLERYEFTTAAKNGWSTMVNLWRDYEVSDRWAVYVGGGIGAGGYRFSYLKLNPASDYRISTSHSVSAFAWQAGGGTAYAITDRITLDIGYRFFQIANATSTAVISYAPGPPVGSEVVGSAFSASELFLAVRVAEPFRNWR